MKALLEQLLAAHGSGRDVIYTCVVETRGSTPQKAGAVMLLFEDGSQLGTLGGGCVEAEVKRRALASFHQWQAELATFVLDHDYGWDDGLVCGGRMTALIAPLMHNQSSDYYQQQVQLLEQDAGFTEAIPLIEGVQGTEPARLLFDNSGKELRRTGNVDDAEAISRSLRGLDERPRPYVTEGIAFLPSLPRCHLIIVGAGHVGQQVARYAAECDFDVCVVDDRQELCNPQQIPWAHQYLVGTYAETLPTMELPPNAFCIIVTRGHHHDEEALRLLLRRQPRYLGMIGSRRKIRLIFEDLLRLGFSEEQLQAVHAPIGLNIFSRTVPEIAISIVAELIQERNRPAESAAPSSASGS